MNNGVEIARVAILPSISPEVRSLVVIAALSGVRSTLKLTIPTIPNPSISSGFADLTIFYFTKTPMLSFFFHFAPALNK
jgi:hypothetical protein